MNELDITIAEIGETKAFDFFFDFTENRVRLAFRLGDDGKTEFRSLPERMTSGLGAGDRKPLTATPKNAPHRGPFFLEILWRRKIERKP